MSMTQCTKLHIQGSNTGTLSTDMSIFFWFSLTSLSGHFYFLVEISYFYFKLFFNNLVNNIVTQVVGRV